MTKYVILQINELKKNQNGDLDHNESTAKNKLSSKARLLCEDDENIQKLGESCWLFPLSITLNHFCALVDLAHNSKLSYRVAYLDDLSWLDFNKK